MKACFRIPAAIVAALGVSSAAPVLGTGVPYSGRVIEVVDGDTLRLEGGTVVTLKGINSPECREPRRLREPFGPEAAAFTRSAVLGRRVRLVLDVTDRTARHRDERGRLLAYVFREADNFDLNAALLNNGLAHVTRRFSASRKREFLTLEAKARIVERGIWAPLADYRPSLPVPVVRSVPIRTYSRRHPDPREARRRGTASRRNSGSGKARPARRTR